MSGKPKTRAEKINRLRELLPTLTPEELAKLVPHQTFIDLAVSLGIQNPNQYGTTVNIIHAINNVLTGQKWVGEKPPELKIDETEGREISQSKRSRTRQDILVFDNPEARAALFEQYPPEWEQQRRALNAQMGSVAECPLAAVLPAPTPA